MKNNKNNKKTCPLRQFCGDYKNAMKVLKVITCTAKSASEVQKRTGFSLSKVYRILRRFEECGIVDIGKMSFRLSRRFSKDYSKWAKVYIKRR